APVRGVGRGPDEDGPEPGPAAYFDSHSVSRSVATDQAAEVGRRLHSVAVDGDDDVRRQQLPCGRRTEDDVVDQNATSLYPHVVAERPQRHRGRDLLRGAHLARVLDLELL